MLTLALFLTKAVGISLSGVMAPGAVTAATVACGTRSRHAGALIAVGHGIVEFPLMLLIMAGMGKIFQITAVKISIGLAGGFFLVLMAWQLLCDSGKMSSTNFCSSKYQQRGPILSGVILTIANPYFLLWWATLGLALANQAIELGVTAFALFAIIHWLCDLVWLEALSWATFKGGQLIGAQHLHRVLQFCAVMLYCFAIMFLYDATYSLMNILTNPA